MKRVIVLSNEDCCLVSKQKHWLFCYEVRGEDSSYLTVNQETVPVKGNAALRDSLTVTTHAKPNFGSAISVMQLGALVVIEEIKEIVQEDPIHVVCEGKQLFVVIQEDCQNPMLFFTRPFLVFRS